VLVHIFLKKKEKRMNGKFLVLDGYVVLHDVDRMHNVSKEEEKKYEKRKEKPRLLI
jgi:hypothetical protein